MERYIKEYASAKIKRFKENGLLDTEYYNKAIRQIKQALAYREKGYLTIDETIKIIMEV